MPERPLPRKVEPTALCGLWASLAMLAAVLAAAHGCQKRAPSAPEPGGGARPSMEAGLRLLSPLPYDVISGRTPVRVGTGTAPAATQLLIDGRAGPRVDDSGRAWLDTQSLSDGLHELQLQAGGQRSSAVQVVVLNKGAEVFFKNGSEGVVRAPALPQAEHEGQHLRYHWDMTPGSRRVLALLTWPGGDFDLELAMGTGTCPHHGIRLAAAHGSRSPVTVLYAPADSDGELPAGQWFAHVRLLSPERVAGQETPFQVRAFLLR